MESQAVIVFHAWENPLQQMGTLINKVEIILLHYYIDLTFL